MQALTPPSPDMYAKLMSNPRKNPPVWWMSGHTAVVARPADLFFPSSEARSLAASLGPGKKLASICHHADTVLSLDLDAGRLSVLWTNDYYGLADGEPAIEARFDGCSAKLFVVSEMDMYKLSRGMNFPKHQRGGIAVKSASFEIFTWPSSPENGHGEIPLAKDLGHWWDSRERRYPRGDAIVDAINAHGGAWRFTGPPEYPSLLKGEEIISGTSANAVTFRELAEKASEGS